MNMIMSSHSSRATSVAAVLFCLVFPATHTEVAVAGEVDPLLPICKTVGGGSTYFGIDFCMAALKSDNRSHNISSEDPVLSTIAVDLLTANATSTAAKIDGLLILRNGSGGGGRDEEDATRRSLQSCQALYAGIVQRQPGCVAAVKARKYGDATASLEASASTAEECEAEFAKRRVVSPLTAEDENAFRLAKLAVACRFTF